MRLEIPAGVVEALDNVLPENWRERIVPEIKFETEEFVVEREYRFTISWPIVGFKNVASYTEMKDLKDWGVD